MRSCKEEDDEEEVLTVSKESAVEFGTIRVYISAAFDCKEQEQTSESYRGTHDKSLHTQLAPAAISKPLYLTSPTDQSEGSLVNDVMDHSSHTDNIHSHTAYEP